MGDGRGRRKDMVIGIGTILLIVILLILLF
jgi:hypothetical protein